MQMSALMTSHVVRLARIDEEVWLSACCDTSLEEGEAVLWHYSHIVQALDNLQLALQVLCLIEQGGLPVTLWVGLWSVHIALAIHHLVPVPVDNRTACYAYLEHVRVVGHQRDGHESAEAPAVNTNLVSIYVRKRLQIFYTLHLVLHLNLSELAESSLLESLATVLASTVVEDEEQIALFCHVGFPTTARVVPARIYVVGMRSTIYIYNGRILLVWVEVYRLHHSPVEVGFAIGSLDGTAAVLRHIVALPRVLGCEVSGALAVLGVHEGNLARYGRSRVVVEDILSVLTQSGTVPSLAAIIYQRTLAGLCIYGKDVSLDR